MTHAAYFALVLTLTFTLLGLPHEGGAAFATIFGLAATFAVGDSVLESQVPAIVQSPTFFASERDRDAANRCAAGAWRVGLGRVPACAESSWACRGWRIRWLALPLASHPHPTP